jgi:threonine dehydrogenase-like Zn-dependent dehydrogenase
VNDLFWRNEITLTSSYGGSPGDYAAALELIQAGKIRVREMIIHRLGLAETGHFCLSLRGAAGDVAISLAKFQILKIQSPNKSFKV